MVNAVIMTVKRASAAVQGVVLGKHSAKNVRKTSVGAIINMKESVQVLQRDSCTVSPWGAGELAEQEVHSAEDLKNCLH